MCTYAYDTEGQITEWRHKFAYEPQDRESVRCLCGTLTLQNTGTLRVWLNDEEDVIWQSIWTPSDDDSPVVWVVPHGLMKRIPELRPPVTPDTIVASVLDLRTVHNWQDFIRRRTRHE